MSLRLERGSLIVSCQAGADNPLHGPVFMAAMALAAKDPKEAGKLVDEVVQKNPNDIEGLVAKAKLLMLERRFDEALVKKQSFKFWEAPHWKRRDGSVTNW